MKYLSGYQIFSMLAVLVLINLNYDVANAAAKSKAKPVSVDKLPTGIKLSAETFKAAISIADSSRNFENSQEKKIQFSAYSLKSRKTNAFDVTAHVLSENDSIAIFGISTKVNDRHSYLLLTVDKTRTLNSSSEGNTSIETSLTYVMGALLGKYSYTEGLSREESKVQANQVMIDGIMYPATLINIPVNLPRPVFGFKGREERARDTVESALKVAALKVSEVVTIDFAREASRLSLRDSMSERIHDGKIWVGDVRRSVETTISEQAEVLRSSILDPITQLATELRQLFGSLGSNLKAQADLSSEPNPDR